MRTCARSASSTLRATYANALLRLRQALLELRLVDLHDRRQLGRVPAGSLITRGSATIVVCGTDTASTLPVRSKMLPRSPGW